MRTPTFIAMILGGLLLAASAHSEAKIKLIGKVSFPGNASDLSGMTGNLEDGSPANRLGGFGSAFAWSGVGDIYWAATDRGPADGKTSFHTRFHKFKITGKSDGLDDNQGLTLSASLLQTNPLYDLDGAGLIGLASAIDLTPAGSKFDNEIRVRRYDPEGIAVHNDEVFVADEYGPFVDVFNTSGMKIRSLPLSEKFRVESLSGTPSEEAPPHNIKGRQPNRGMEGLTFNAATGKLYGIMQSSLIQDNAQDAAGNRTGEIVRIVEIDPGAKPTDSSGREFAYKLDSAKNGVSEIFAIGRDDFLVLERDGKIGEEARSKRIYRINIGNATDVSAVEALPCCDAPAGMSLVTKTLMIDLLSPEFGLAGTSFPEKPEGLTFGPDFSNGDKLLFVSVDNDFIEAQPSVIWAFRVPASLLK